MPKSGRPEPRAAASPTNAPHAMRPKVLVVDDHPQHRLRAETVFAQFGCSVTVTETGEAGLRASAAEAFDLIVLDRRMPGMDGDAVARRLRAEPGPSRGAFVACCSTDPPRELSAGYDIVVPKPLTPDVAAAILEAAFRRSPTWSHLGSILAPWEP